MESGKSLVPKVIFYALLTICFIILISIIISMSTIWYIWSFDGDTVSEIVYVDLYKGVDIQNFGDGDIQKSYIYFTKYLKGNKIGQIFLTAGVFEYFSAFLVIGLIAVTIMSHFKKNKILPKLIIGLATVLSLFQIITISVVRSLPRTFKDSYGYYRWGKHFSGSEDGYVWGPTTGFNAGVSSLVFSIIGIFPSFLRYYYLNHQLETPYLDKSNF